MDVYGRAPSKDLVTLDMSHLFSLLGTLILFDSVTNGHQSLDLGPTLNPGWPHLENLS